MYVFFVYLCFDFLKKESVSPTRAGMLSEKQGKFFIVHHICTVLTFPADTLSLQVNTRYVKSFSVSVQYESLHVINNFFV